MTPDQLEAIRLRARHSQRPAINPHPEVGQRAVEDREALLDHVDTLEATSGSIEANLSRWKASFWEQRKAAAHLLAHQQARALELAAERSRYSTALDTIVSLECDSDDLADTCGCASCRAHEALASSDELSELAIRDTEIATLRAEIARKDAEIQRLKTLLAKTHEAWTWEANQGDGIDERHAPLWEAARYAITGICNHGREDMSSCRTCEDAVAALGEEAGNA